MGVEIVVYPWDVHDYLEFSAMGNLMRTRLGKLYTWWGLKRLKRWWWWSLENYRHRSTKRGAIPQMDAVQTRQHFPLNQICVEQRGWKMLIACHKHDLTVVKTLKVNVSTNPLYIRVPQALHFNDSQFCLWNINKASKPINSKAWNNHLLETNIQWYHAAYSCSLPKAYILAMEVRSRNCAKRNWTWLVWSDHAVSCRFSQENKEGVGMDALASKLLRDLWWFRKFPENNVFQMLLLISRTETTYRKNWTSKLLVISFNTEFLQPYIQLLNTK